MAIYSASKFAVRGLTQATGEGSNIVYSKGLLLRLAFLLSSRVTPAQDYCKQLRARVYPDSDE